MKNCWANSLGNCHGKLTGEHIISNSILEKKIKAKGFSWCKDEPKDIGSSSLKGKILCEKHNNELSTFDSEAKQFISVMNNVRKKSENFKKFGFRKKDIPIIYKLDSSKLERWCCKTLINVSLTQKDKVIIHYDNILPEIFQNRNFENPYGLNFAITIGQKIDAKDFFEIAPLLNETSDKEKELAGGLFTFIGFRLILLLPCSKQDIIINNELQLHLSKDMQEEWIGLQLNWHNREINYTNQQGKKKHLMQRINFKW